MQIKPFPYHTLPRFSRAQVHCGRLLRSHLGSRVSEALDRWATRRAADGAPMTQALIHSVAVLPGLTRSHVDDFFRRSAAILPLTGPNQGQAALALDQKLVSAVFGLYLGEQVGPVPTPPTPGHRGVLAFALAELLWTLGPECCWSLTLAEVEEYGAPGARERAGAGEPAGAGEGAGAGEVLGAREETGAFAEGAVVFEAAVQLNQTSGLAWLVVDAAAFQQAPPVALQQPASRRQRLAGLVYALPLEVARFSLAEEDWQSVSPGDTVVFARCPRPDLPLQGVLRLGAGGFPWALEEDGAHISEPFRLGGLGMPAEESHQEQTAQQLPVEVVVELGRVKLTGAQVMDLNAGDVLPLDRPLKGAVELRVGDRLLAQGELVDVEGEAGVRLIRLFD